MPFHTLRIDVLRVNEIFHSIQGESSYAGTPCVFVRLTGCNLRCSYCDTAFAYEEGEEMSISEVVDAVRQYDFSWVELTGGEPLLQEETPRLVQGLLNDGLNVLVETNGTRDIDAIPGNAIIVMDIKCPGSGEAEKTDWDNIGRLGPWDEIKFVLMDRADYEWAGGVIERYGLTENATVLFSPAHGILDPACLAQWILEDGLKVRLQLQLHRIIWPDEERGR